MPECDRDMVRAAPATNPIRRTRLLLAGLALAALYVGSTAVTPFAPRQTGPHPPHGRMLYDGLVPQPPYRWVRSPAGRGDNEPPQPYTGEVPLGAAGSVAAELSTDDLQATVTLPAGVIEPRAGETNARVTLTPLDPGTLAPPPAGRHFDGNAYRVSAVYATSGAPAAPRSAVTIVLRYPVHASTILRLETAAGTRTWTRLATTVFTGSQENLAHSDRFGVFAASGP